MAIVTAANTSSPNTVKWATSTADPYELATQLRGVAENFDLHDHSAGKNLGVFRLQTATAPSASGQVRVNGDALQWWGATAGAVQTAVRTTLPQFLGGTSNAFSTAGLTVNQGAADDEAISIKSSDVAHGMTSVTETDTYVRFRKLSATGGGLLVDGFSSATQGLYLRGNHTTDDTAKTNGARAAVVVSGLVKSGTSVATLAANANILTVETNGTTRFILDADGDSHQDVGTAWTTFDDYDDAALLTALTVGVSRPGDPVRERFLSVLEENRGALERARLVTFNDDGHHFVNMSRLTMALVGAVRQQAVRIDGLEQRLALKEG